MVFGGSVRAFGSGRCLPRDGLWDSVRVFDSGRCLPRGGLRESVRMSGQLVPATHDFGGLGDLPDRISG